LKNLAIYQPSQLRRRHHCELQPGNTPRRRWSHRWICLQILFATLGMALTATGQATAQASQQDGTKDAEELMNHVGEPTPQIIAIFKGAGMQGVVPHTLTTQERAKIEAVLASLPELHRRVLEKHLNHLAFVDGIPGEGSGLTSKAAKAGMDDITLRASLLDEPLSTFLTIKEQRLYADDGSGTTVTVTGTGVNALTYILLHETSHVVDQGCSITSDPNSPFVAGIWTTGRKMATSLASVAPVTYFRGASAIPISKAASVYDALAKTPFVSAYATASPNEDFAELVAWHEILRQHQGKLVIEVKNVHGEILKHWEPLTFPEVQSRFTEVDELLASQGHCKGL
jgi:hypothetical protein